MEKPVAQARKSLEVEQKPVVDLTKCYFCMGKVTAKCATCKIPVCDEHVREACGYFSQAITILCVECAIMMRNW
jgi:hypothetical protein